MSRPEVSRAAEVLDQLVRDQQRRSLFRRGGAAPIHGTSGAGASGAGASGDEAGPDVVADPFRGAATPRGFADIVSRGRRLGAAALVVVAVVTAGLVVVQRRPPPIEDRLPRAGAEASASGPAGNRADPASGGGSGDVATGEAIDAGSVEDGPGSAGSTTDSQGAVGAPAVVHVAGAVASPGVVELPRGGRVVDAVRAAGGLLPDADADRVNLAAPLADGQRIVIPVVGQPEPVEVPPSGPPNAAPTAMGTAGTAGAGGSATVDVNSADASALETLPGIGPATAAAIIAHRESSGPFTSVDSLLDVRGIGDAKLEGLRDLVTVGR